LSIRLAGSNVKFDLLGPKRELSNIQFETKSVVFLSKQYFWSPWKPPFLYPNDRLNLLQDVLAERQQLPAMHSDKVRAIEHFQNANAS